MTLKVAELAFENNTFYIKGVLCISNVMSLYSKSLPYFDGDSPVQFDFSEVEDSDSAGLALMIEWIRVGEKLNQSVTFKSIPQGLLSIAKAARLENMLRCNADNSAE